MLLNPEQKHQVNKTSHPVRLETPDTYLTGHSQTSKEFQEHAYRFLFLLHFLESH